MKTTTIQSWQDFNETLYSIPLTDFGRHRSDFVYRGLGSADWNLETTLIRLRSTFDRAEEVLFRSFLKYAQPEQIPSDSFWGRLAIAQHYGLPTRLLDWTSAPRVAAHFATWEVQHFDKDGVIWAVDAGRARSLLPSHLQKRLYDHYAYVFSIEMLSDIQTFSELKKLNEKHGPFLLFFEPPSLDGRIINQAALFSALTDPGLVLDKFLEEHDLLWRIVIPKELKWEIRDKLDQDNVTERMLFPGLDGNSRWLKRYYGPGPNAVSTGTRRPGGSIRGGT